MPRRSMQGADHDRERRFTDLYGQVYRPLLGYVLRRVDQPADAADVLADVFVVAWRRLDEIPEGKESRLWLFGVARRTIANHRRGLRRREATSDRLCAQFEAMIAQVARVDHMREPRVTSALERLNDGDREVLTLTTWEELSPTEVAQVLGIKPATARVRLHRARGRLREELQVPRDPGIDRSTEHPMTRRASRSATRREA